MNNLLEKNLTALKQKNPELAKKLATHIPNDIPQLTRDNGYYNFLYKQTHLHNPINPLGEAKEIFSMADNNPTAIHLVFGLGLGYLFQITSANSQGTVILYEPDLNIMHTAFCLVDFTGDINKQNVYITNSIDTAEEYIYQKSNMKNTPLLLSTSSYQKINEENFNDMVNRLQNSIGRYGLDLKYTKEKLYPVLLQLLNNIPQIVKQIPLMEIKDYYKDATAVVVSAGPTLDRNLETIKKYRDNIVLIVVGTAMKTIAAHGLKPDFLCIIESNDCSKQIQDIDMDGVNFVTEPFSHPMLLNKNYSRVFSHASSNTPVNHFWSEIAGINIDNYYSKGTVSYTALNTARILGCKKIVMVGQDLAYIEGQCYSKDSAYKDLECRYNQETKKWEITARDFEHFVQSLGNHPDHNILVKIAQERIDNLNKSLFFVKGIQGDMIPTESVYSTFIQPLTEFTKNYPGIDYINTSLVGAQIDGYRNISLEEALKDSTKIANRTININHEINILSVKDNLFRAKKELQQTTFILDEIQKMTKNLKNDLIHSKTITKEILEKLKRIMTGYHILSNENTKKSKLLDFIIAADVIDLDYEIKMIKEFSLEVITGLIEKVNNFCQNTNSRIKEISDIIELKIGEI